MNSSVITPSPNKSETRLSLYLWSIAVAGLVALCVSATRIPFREMDFRFVIVVVFTLFVSSRVVVKIPILKSNISTAELFIFLSALLFGAPAAVLLTALEGSLISWRMTHTRRILFFNAGTVTSSFFVASVVTEHYFGPINHLPKDHFSNYLIAANSVLILTHFSINSALVSFANSMREQRSVIDVWKESYPWVSVTYLASGSIALALAVAIENFGFPVFLAGVPLIGIIYFSLNSYQEKIEASEAKSEQAKKHLVEMQASEQRFRGAFGDAPIGMALLSPEGACTKVNQSLCRLLGYDESELIGFDLSRAVHEGDLVEFLSRVGSVIKQNQESFQTEIRLFHKDGRQIWTSTNVSLIEATSENGAQLIVQVQDITEKRNAIEKLRYAAFHDSLTNLGNRTLLLEKLNASLRRSKSDPDFRLALAFLDVDRFKSVNDSFGHTTGDELLIAIYDRLRNLLGANAIIARLGGDEFTIVMTEFPSTEGATEFAQKIQEHLSSNYKIRGHSFYVSVSLGVVFLNDQYRTPEEILRDADTALHEAKRSGQSRVVVFDEKMHAKVLRQLQLETDLRYALERDQIFLVYQPIIRLDTNELIGLEALARWNHPGRGLVSPVEFIPLAEETGDIAAIGKFVLKQACRQLKIWEMQFGKHFPLSINVNVSAHQFNQGKLLECVLDELTESQIQPNQLKLEITESVVVDNIESASITLKQLRALGVQVNLDDFGTGYSSLIYLHRLPITALKIDRTFIMNLENESDSRAIVQAIIMLSKSLNLEVVAEGIETSDQLQLLREFGCELGQGYFFAKPLDVAAVEELIVNRRPIPDSVNPIMPSTTSRSILNYDSNPLS